MTGPGRPLGGERVRDLLRRCGETRDRAERAVLLTRMAHQLDQAANEVAAHGAPESHEVAAALRGQARMARSLADLEHEDRAGEITSGSRAS